MSFPSPSRRGSSRGWPSPIPPRLELLDANGTVLAVGSTDADNTSQSISDFLAPGGTVYARLSGGTVGIDASYALVITRGVVLDLELGDPGFQDVETLDEFWGIWAEATS